MANKLVAAVIFYSLSLFYGFLVCLALLWDIIRHLRIPSRAKKRETRKYVPAGTRHFPLRHVGPVRGSAHGPSLVTYHTPV